MAKGKYERWITKEGLALIEGWAHDGLTDEQIANNIGINRDTLYTWKKKYPDISDALKKGKEVVDYQVENVLLRKALGMEYQEELMEPDGSIQTVTRKMPPDTTAIIFWLKNRRPDRWRDKQEIEHSGTMNNNVNLSGLSLEELRAIAKDETDD
nr:MAG TPA: terminase small subunit [Caudoviricetes sp.]